MSTGIVIAIVVGVIIIAAVAVWLAIDGRRRQLRKRFGPEYDRLAKERGSRRAAETELLGRQRHVAELNIHPLSAEQRSHYTARWAAIQEEFVERPQEALGAATSIITAAMRDRGYPTEDHSQISADLSVNHAHTLDQFRNAHGTSVRAGSGSASTEELRRAMIDYRAVFEDLVGSHTDGAGARPGAGPGGGRVPGTSPAGADVPTTPAGTAPTTPAGTAPARTANTPPAGNAQNTPAGDESSVPVDQPTEQTAPPQGSPRR